MVGGDAIHHSETLLHYEIVILVDDYHVDFGSPEIPTEHGPAHAFLINDEPLLLARLDHSPRLQYG
jgi:hypothetical protein